MVGRTLIDEAAKLLGVEFGGLVVVGEELDRAVGVVARMQGHDVEWFGETDIDLREETSGAASAVFGGLPLAVFDADASPLVHRRLVERTGAKSTAYIPLVAEGRVLAVLAVASTSARRMFTSDDLALLQALANEAALALDRLRSSAALADALERERVIGRIAAKFRTQLDLDSVIRVAVEETARTLGAQRAFIRLGDPADVPPIAFEWHTPEVEPIGANAKRLPVSNLALRERRTVAVERHRRRTSRSATRRSARSTRSATSAAAQCWRRRSASSTRRSACSRCTDPR